MKSIKLSISSAISMMYFTMYRGFCFQTTVLVYLLMDEISQCTYHYIIYFVYDYLMSV